MDEDVTQKDQDTPKVTGDDFNEDTARYVVAIGMGIFRPWDFGGKSARRPPRGSLAHPDR